MSSDSSEGQVSDTGNIPEEQAASSSKSKLKQSPDDKRMRNYIAVKKHRQQLKDTLERCPITLVELTKELDDLSTDESKTLDLIAEFENLVGAVKKKMPPPRKPREPRVEMPPPSIQELSPSTSYGSRRRGSPEESSDTSEQVFKRPRRVFPNGVPTDLLPQTQLSYLSPSFPAMTSPLLQPLVNPLLSPLNFYSSPLLQSPLINPFLMPTPTPLPSPVQFQPMFTMTPETMISLQGMLAADYLQSAAARTAPINFTQDNIDYLWRMCNEQLR